MTTAVSADDPDMPLRVVVVDDHPLFRDTVRRLLSTAGFAVVGEAADGAEALVAAGALHPDLVLLDVQLPDLDGFQVAQELARFPSPPAVILVSSRDQGDFGGLVERSPAIGFVAKTDLTGALVHDLFDRFRST